jgi:hypothetical protein
LIPDVGGGSNEAVNCIEKEASQNSTDDLDRDFNTNAQPILDPIWR